MIEVRGLSKRFGPTAALGGISFSVRPGEVVGFLGPNGAGKSTTLRILTTYLMPSGGAALVEGFDVLDKPLEVRRRVGYLPENAPLYADMTVEDLLRFGARMKGIPRSGVEAAVGSVCERCGIVPRRKFAVSQLSRGYRQRTHLALALLANPPVLLLDEPTAGLDPVQTQEIRRLIRELGAERTVLLSTHLLAEVEAVSTRAILIHRGRIVGDGPFETLRRKAEPDARISFSVRARGGIRRRPSGPFPASASSPSRSVRGRSCVSSSARPATPPRRPRASGRWRRRRASRSASSPSASPRWRTSSSR